MLGRLEEKTLTEKELEELVVNEIKGLNAPVLFQSSSQNIDRIVTFYRATQRLGRTFVVDIYTANILYELRQLGNNLCLLYTSPSPRDGLLSRMPSSA